MPSSQNHRPAVTVRTAHSSRTKSSLKRAADLEDQLSSLPKGNDEKAARLRGHLCEVLSDLLISDPVVATENDCTGRLWRNCFYTPIGVWRNRITREKRKHGPNLASFEKSFKVFLGEAVTLYDYLVHQYHSKLLPPSSQDASVQSTQDSQTIGPSSCDGVVAGLYKLYIHLGDLHRYGEAFPKAETCYMNASRIAPGMGNPYNQLAVVAQMRDSNMSCVALYWYARSLLATHDAFQTSGNNLDRLFTINREYLKEHGRDSEPPILPSVGKKPVGDSQAMRTQKAAASKSCLAHFVDFNYELFRNDNSDSVTETSLREKLEAIHRSLESLLNASAFGDALLCKIVVIAVFSFEMNKQGKNRVNQRLSLDLLLTVGAALGERLQQGFGKIFEKAEKLPPSIRLLLPCLLLCDYVSEIDLLQGSHMENSFWNQVVLAGNLAMRVAEKFGIDVPTVDEREVTWDAIKDYQSLRGFKPFGFINKYCLSDEPFISPEEAVFFLELSKSQSQQPASNGSGDTNAKIVRFVQFCQRCVKIAKVPVLWTGNEFRYHVEEEHVNTEILAQETNILNLSVSSVHPGKTEEKVVSGNSDETISNKSTVETNTAETNFEEDGAGDVVMYNAPENGGPKLLVPSALLTGSIETEPAGTNLMPLSTPSFPASSDVPAKNIYSVAVGSVSAQNQSQLPPPGLTPPPGFGAPLTQGITNMPIQYGYSVQQPLVPGTPAYFQGDSQYPFQHGSQNGMAAQSSMSYVNSNFRAVEDSFDWFGGSQALRTANPFANMQPNFAAPQGHLSFAEADSSALDGDSLLGSGFLESLWTNDGGGSRTANPFATNRNM